MNFLFLISTYKLHFTISNKLLSFLGKFTTINFFDKQAIKKEIASRLYSLSKAIKLDFFYF